MSLESYLREAALECEERSKDGWIWTIEIRLSGPVIRASFKHSNGELLSHQRLFTWREFDSRINPLNIGMDLMQKEMDYVIAKEKDND